MIRTGSALMVLVGMCSSLQVEAAPERGATLAPQHTAQRSAGSKSGIAATGSVVVTGNLDKGTVSILDAENKRVIQTIDVSAALPGMCSQGGCFIVGTHHSRIKGHDYVEVAVSPKMHQYGMIARLSLKSPYKPAWRLTTLDFTGVSNNGLCPDEAADNSRPYFGCGVQLPHEVVITDEDPDEKWVEMIIAEMTTSRVVKVHLDYAGGNSTGQVLWTLDTSVTGWDETIYMPNYVHLADGPEGRFLVVTLVSQDSTEAFGTGRILMWDIGGSEPELQWEYPANDENGDGRYLNSVHGGTIQADPLTGQYYLMYGHSLSLGTGWGTGEYGTVGIARVDDFRTMPTYLGDWQLPESFEPFSFPRELEFLPDGTLFATEGGCFYYQREKVCDAQNYWIKRPNLPSTDKHGSFSLDRSDMNIVPLPPESVQRELRCGLGFQFEADVIPADAFGSELTSLYGSATQACSAE